MLRDSKHSREDPLETIPDIRYFYEPLHSLEKSEQKFMIDLIREVLKMMVFWPNHGFFVVFVFFAFFWWLALSEKFCFKHLVSWFVKNVTPFFGWEICVFFVFFWMFQGLIVKLAPFF